MRLDEDTLLRVDRWRGELDDVPSRAEAIRRLIERGLARDATDSIRLTDGDKLVVVMLRDIYKHLKLEHGEIDPDLVADAIFGGHLWAPKWQMQGLFHDHEDTEAELRFVTSVLDMWHFLESGYSQLSKKDKEWVAKEADLVGDNLAFEGFDGNDEGTFMSIAGFLVENMRRFPRLKGRGTTNSHAPRVGAYRRMLTVFDPIRRNIMGNDLSAAQIVEVLKA
jgi:uncharacterized protein YfbU (UPF0304 family)